MCATYAEKTIIINDFHFVCNNKASHWIGKHHTLDLLDLSGCRNGISRNATVIIRTKFGCKSGAGAGVKWRCAAERG